MSRKKIFANLAPASLDVESVVTHQTKASDAPPTRLSRARPLLGSEGLNNDADRTPVGALGQSLGEINQRAKRADQIEEMLKAGQTVVDIDTDVVETSFIPDRMSADDDAFLGFVDSIRAEGQQVPILVRPHPEDSSKYQVAFGHRRLRAAAALKRPVKAIVRNLSDQELVVAQGQENNERQDLSYIEKVRFAQRLVERGFSREVIMSALAVYKSDLSNMLAVGAKVSSLLIEKIGPAHGVGRRNWMALADALSGESRLATKALQITEEVGFGALASKDRFDAVARALKEGSVGRPTELSVSHQGREIGRISSSKHRVTLTIDRSASPEFAEFVLQHLPQIYDEFRDRRGQSSQT